MASNTRKTGSDRDDFFDVGVRATVATPLQEVWQFLVGDGLPLWLGETEMPREQNAGYATADGVRGVIHRYAEDSRVKLTWRPKDWPHNTTLTLAVKRSDAGTTISISHEGLADREERRMMLGYWKTVIADLAAAAEAPQAAELPHGRATPPENPPRA
jgi:uncharacterized protein YndB with AHSA1/START domain